MGLMRERNLEDEYSKILDDLGLHLDINMEPDKEEKEGEKENK